MKVLVTGFDPFGGEAVNPAYEAVKNLPDVIAGAQIIKLEIPTVFGKGADVTIKQMSILNPDVVINVGQAGGRAQICMEKVAINLQEARIEDNEGNQPVNKPVREGGETAYFATIPVKAMTENLKNHGIPAGVSYTAGTYVCNDVMYRIAHYIQTQRLSAKSGFIHVPYAAEQVITKPADTPSMSLEMITQGIAYAIETAINESSDIDTAMGEIT